jgi:hypothetical protein
VKRVIRAVSLKDAEAFVSELLGMDSHREIEPRVREWMDSRFDVGRFAE